MRVFVRINDVQLPMVGSSCRASVLRLYDGNSTQLAARQLIGTIFIASRNNFDCFLVFVCFVLLLVTSEQLKIATIIVN